MPINYIARAQAALGRYLRNNCPELGDSAEVALYCSNWRLHGSDLEGGGAMGSELHAAWKAWSDIIPDANNYYFEGDGAYALEDELGNWLLDDNAFFTEKEISEIDGWVCWQGRGPQPADSWQGKTFYDLWRAFRALQSKNNGDSNGG